MNIENILELVDWDKIVKTIESENKLEINPDEYQTIYDGEHEILNRPDKVKKNEAGESVGLTTVAKMVLKYQKKIVESSVAFLLGVPVSLSKVTEGGDESYIYLKDSLKKLKFDNENRNLARKLFTQTRATKLYFIKNPGDKLTQKISSLVLSSENGSFYPNFNDNGDMDAFLRLYKRKKIVDGKSAEVDVFELYTAEKIVFAEKQGGAWLEVEGTQPNPYLKIPVVYYEQEAPEWDDVQTLIERQELSLSELVDTNQYFGSPTAVALGKMSSMPDKQDNGKIIELQYVTDPSTGNMMESKLSYLTWDQRPESLKFQFDLIEKYIYSFSQTADISFSNLLENKPGNISGVALKILLLDPILKALNKQEIFEENLQRELSVVKSILSVMETKHKKNFETMDIDITFNSILPDNISEVIDYLTVAAGGEAIISQETAVQKNPLVKDKEAEIERLQAKAANEAGTFNL